MLIVDIYTLQTVNPLYLADHVILHGTHTLDRKDIVWIYTTLCQLITGLKLLSLQNLDTGTVWDQISLAVTGFFIGYDNLTLLLSITNAYSTAELSDDCKTLRLTCLEKLLDTRKTLCDIITGYTTGMECTHGKLCTRLTDGLSSDNTDSLTNLYRLTCCHVSTITFCTDTDVRLTCQDCTDLNPCLRTGIHNSLCSHNTCCALRCDHVVCLHDQFTVIIINILTGESSCNTFFQRLDQLLAICKLANLHARNLVSFCTTVNLTDGKLLRYINKSTCQVSGIGCTKRCIGQTPTSTMRGNEVLQYVKTLTEVRLDREFNRTTGCIRHQSTHTGKLLDLCLGTTGSGIRHHKDVVVTIQTSHQSLCQLIIGCEPCIYNCLVTLLLRQKTTVELACNCLNGLFCIRKNILLRCRHGHIGNRYCHGCTGRILVT